MRSVGAATEDVVVEFVDVLPPQAVISRDIPSIILTTSALREALLLGFPGKEENMKITSSIVLIIIV
jgi:hypothetical protein